MARERIGGRPARYAFLLNPYSDTRLSKCPTCDRPTHPRKFALFIHVDAGGPLALGKTCRYCARCELVIAHQDELDAEVARCLSTRCPDAVGKEYFVLGTLERKLWRQSLQGAGPSLGEALQQLAEFQQVLMLQVDPGGWRPAGDKRPG